MKRIIIMIILLLLVAAGLYAYKEYNRKNSDLGGTRAAATTDALSLITTFERDSASANKQYLDKVVAVQGTIKKIERDGNPVIIFLGDAARMSSVQCSMDSTHALEYSDLTKGAMVTIKGRVNGAETDELLGTDVKLNRCVIENKEH